MRSRHVAYALCLIVSASAALSHFPSLPRQLENPKATDHHRHQAAAKASARLAHRRPAMALRAATAPFVMLLLLLLVPTGCSDQGGGGDGCFAPLIGCAPPASATGNATAFRASLTPLLAAVPSVAAAAAEGFAALRSEPDPGRDGAHALGLCFGFGGAEGDASDCHACLRAAVAAAGEGCADYTRRAGVWGDGCLLAYYAGDVASSSSYTDGLEQTVADDLAMALAQPKGQSLWRKARSIMFFVLAAIGAVTVVVLACLLLGCYLLAETLVGNMAAAGP